MKKKRGQPGRLQRLYGGSRDIEDPKRAASGFIGKRTMRWTSSTNRFWLQRLWHPFNAEPGPSIWTARWGGGGHAFEILRNSAPNGRLIGIDTDANALREAQRRLAPFGDRAILLKGNFATMETILAGMNIGGRWRNPPRSGVSSHQLDTAGRGFSFAVDALLDMRMDQDQGPSAYDLIHTLSRDELAKIIRNYGEERMAGRIARAIVERRILSPIERRPISPELWPRHCLRPGDPPGSTRPPGPSRLSESPSTTNSPACGRLWRAEWSISRMAGASV